MQSQIDSMIDAFESGKLTRRQLVARLGAAVTALAGFDRVTRATAPLETATFRAKSVDHIALRVTDVSRSRDFYVKHLGLEVARQGTSNCFLKCGDDFVALFRSPKAGMHHYCYRVNGYNADAVVQRAKDAGLSPRREENRVYFPDPDGLTVQVAAKSDW